jgi:ribose transport system permease protein
MSAIGHASGIEVPRASDSGLKIVLWVIRIGPPLILLLLCLILTLMTPFFLTGDNLTNLLVQVAPLAALAIGQLFVILVGGIDLSVGSLIALTTVTGSLAFQHGGGGFVVLVAMLLTGLLAGLINAVLYVKGRMPHSFIPTLAMLNAASGLALLLSDGRPTPGMPGIVTTIGGEDIAGIPIAIIVVAALGGFAGLLARKLRWGRWIYLVGGDREAARRLGIPVDRVVMSVFLISGFCAAVAGVITAGRTNAGFPTAGQLQELASISAVIIGGASFWGGRGTVTGAVVGAFIFGVINNGLNLLNVSVYWQLIAIGLILVIAVELDVLRRRLEERFRTLQAHGSR